MSKISDYYSFDKTQFVYNDKNYILFQNNKNGLIIIRVKLNNTIYYNKY